jgi:hypothetical protein
LNFMMTKRIAGKIASAEKRICGFSTENEASV